MWSISDGLQHLDCGYVMHQPLISDSSIKTAQHHDMEMGKVMTLIPVRQTTWGGRRHGWRKRGGRD